MVFINRYLLVASLVLLSVLLQSHSASAASNSKFAGFDESDDDLFGDDKPPAAAAKESKRSVELDLGDDDGLFNEGGEDTDANNDEAIEQELANPSTDLVNRGIFFAESGNEEVALRFFRTAVKRNPQNPNFWLNLGTCLMNKAHAIARKQIPRGRAQKRLFSELNEAVQCFNTGLALRPRAQDQGLLVSNRKIALRGLHEIFPRKCPRGICVGADVSPKHGDLPEKFQITPHTVGDIKAPTGQPMNSAEEEEAPAATTTTTSNNNKPKKPAVGADDLDFLDLEEPVAAEEKKAEKEKEASKPEPPKKPKKKAPEPIDKDSWDL